MNFFCIFIFTIYSFDFPIDYYSYRTDNGIWNFSEFVKKHHIYHITISGQDYYFTFLDYLKKYDLPAYCENNIYSHYSAVVCNNISEKCYPLISNNSFIARKLESIDKLDNLIDSNGITISGIGDPVNINGQNISFEIAYEFYCNKLDDTSSSSHPKTQLILDDKIPNFYHFILKFNSIYGCPSNFLVKSDFSNPPKIIKSSNESKYQTHFIFEEGDYKIDIDISNYNFNQSTPDAPSPKLNTTAWQANVASYGPIHNYDLLFQFSEGIQCPTGFTCNGDENATVLLCHAGICDAYGLLANGIRSSLAPISGMNGGVSVFYEGRLNRSAVITFECDRSNDAQIRLPTGIRKINTTVYFSIGTKDACPLSDLPNPSPLPSVHIPMPKNVSSSPTPNPIPGADFFVRNSTHYVTFSMNKLSQSLFKGNLPLLVDGDLGVMYTEYSPWELIECPKGWNCSAGQEANLWGCWNVSQSEIGKSKIESIFVPYCHPIGDKRICSTLTPLAPNKLDRGVILKYCGAYTMFSELKIECDRVNSPSLFSLHDSSVIFHRSLNGPDVSYNMSSSLVCPSEFSLFPFPSPKPEPTPTFDPDSQPDFKFISPVVNKSQIVLDMSLFRKSEQWTVFKENKDFELSFVVFNPTQQVECPNEYSCIGSNLSNVWKCSKNFQCFSVGDSRYNLSFKLNDENDLNNGVSAIYGGGLAGFSFEIKMICDESRKDKLLEFSDVNWLKSDISTISVSTFTSFACPISIDPNKGIDDLHISIGSMFILALLICFILYISIGSFLMFLKNGIIEMPNSHFWSEFVSNVKTATMFLLTCGNTEIRREREKYSGI